MSSLGALSAAFERGGGSHANDAAPIVSLFACIEATKPVEGLGHES